MIKRNLLIAALVSAFMCLCPTAKAQLSTNPDKFLGNITTRGSVDTDGLNFYKLWNQITPENESKWDACEPQRNNFTWGGADRSYNYAKQHKFPYKHHCLIWGAQYPKWMDNLSTAEQYKAIVEYMDALKKHYPTIDMIDVVNEAVAGHQPAPYKDALGGDGKTGYDWIIKAFEMAHERWPDAILIYNDYNTFQWQKTEFINLVRTLRDAGAPIDAYGCQSHDLTDMNFNDFKSAMTEIQNALKMPMYSTEYDIGTTDDQKQLRQYRDQIQYMWEQPYVAGVTLWGYIYGKTWTTDGNSGIIKNGKDRPAMTWLREYMATDAAKTAKSPFPGFKKEASLYVKPKSLNITINEPTTITVNARLRTKTIEKVELYAGTTLLKTMTEAPYVVEYTTSKIGKVTLKAKLYDTEGNVYERLSSVTANEPRKPFKDVIQLPGTIEAENFDKGAEGVSYHDSNSNKEGDGASYRTDGGIDIVKGNNGYAIGYTNSGEWMEYTVNVKEAGTYEYEVVASSGSDGAIVNMQLNTDNGLKSITGDIKIPYVDWNTYKTIKGRLTIPLEAGEQIIRINVVKTGVNIDKVKFTKVTLTNDIKCTITADPMPATVNTNTVISVDATTTTGNIARVNLYVNGELKKTFTAAPYNYTYRPTAVGTVSISAVAYDEDGRQCQRDGALSLVVNKKRTPYKTTPIELPGTIEVENFDKCGEGMSFHDSDATDEGKAGYRTDNEGVDIVKSDNRYVLGYTAVGEWVEYTVNVKEAGKYSYEATVSSGVTGSAFTIGVVQNGKVTNVSNKIVVPQTASNSWDTYKVKTGSLTRELEAGQQIIRITINGANCNIDKIKFICTTPTGVEEVEAIPSGLCDVYTMSGVYVGRVSTASSMQMERQIQSLTSSQAGLYVIKDGEGNARKIVVGK